MLSYDWLKILLAIGAAIAVLCILFTMIRTRPTTAQEYEVFGFGPVQYGESSSRFQDELDSILSYEILRTGQEKINYDNSGTQVLMARRAASTGTVVFAPDFAATEGAQTAFGYLCETGLRNAGKENESMGVFLDLDKYFPACEAYLMEYFGENWENAEIDMARVRTDFLARNKKDKRFRYSSKKREAGILDEKKRLEDLREDYLVVKKAIFEDGTLSIVRYKHEVLDENGEDQGTGRSYPVGINVGTLAGMKKIFYYTDAEANRVSEKINLMLFDNGEKTAYTRYETVTLLRHLLENYAES